jgi:NADH-quinone oxidoreductase subunit J
VAEALLYVLSALALAFAIGVIGAKSPLTSILNLLGCFVSLAGIYLLAGFQFLAAAQLLVYAGAIMVLFLFVVMLLNLGDPSTHEHTLGMPRIRLGVAIASACALALAGIGAAASLPEGATLAADPELAKTGYDSVKSIANLLFGKYALVFQAAGLLLLATMVGVIVLAKRQRGAIQDGRPHGSEISLGDMG